ncbi:Veg family protein [Tuanshanicoccus lijuaniae]|uniref:Veg family protein n=1 Tax=Aerococcaceae bacterium zg-1292 TaxID=2774330 RepID=UPI00193859EE|nr:Veg family protein [Aerococcaceae bacterium zg-1292]MBF6626846.1 Veg family protein [Aerococcaceae bacterium zg-BR9]MBF6978760.1 Veg family protein [Aerococcaceae bacterium zg-BR22]MBS4456792.1 Veg family protein [Aerococcaceae bacterium zg-A91]MBS4458584.1 Veg family protein [Aerococcaceae bacterium zg-BR33]
MPKDLVAIKSLLEENVGETIIVTVQMGRKKKRERRGILKETYRSIFVVDLDQEANNIDRVSYSYRDVLTHAIDLEFVNED